MIDRDENVVANEMQNYISAPAQTSYLLHSLVPRISLQLLLVHSLVNILFTRAANCFTICSTTNLNLHLHSLSFCVSEDEELSLIVTWSTQQSNSSFAHFLSLSATVFAIQTCQTCLIVWRWVRERHEHADKPITIMQSICSALLSPISTYSLPGHTSGSFAPITHYTIAIDWSRKETGSVQVKVAIDFLCLTQFMSLVINETRLFFD